MKILMDKSVSLNWNRRDGQDTVDTYEFRAGVFSVDLPKNVADYMIENYKDNILDLDDKVEEVKPVEEVIKEVKAASVEKVKKFEEKKAEEEKQKSKPTPGLSLADLAKNA